MKTQISCPHCGEQFESDSSSKRNVRDLITIITYVLVFGIAGWVLLSEGHLFWGAACLVGALVAPVTHEMATRYEQQLLIRARDKERLEMERLIEIARAETSKTAPSTND